MASSKIRLYGSTSGYVELEAPAVAPDASLVLPSTSGGFGKLVDVKHALKTDTFSSSVTAGNNVAVTDLTITHEVANASNKLIISMFIGSFASSEDQAEGGIAVYDGTSFIAVGASPGSRTAFTAGGRPTSSTTAFNSQVIAATIVHTPGAGSKTYTVHAFNSRTGTATLYINRNEDDTNSGGRWRTVSSLVIQEVAA